MKIYIDDEYICHILNDGTMREFEVPHFDGKCSSYIESSRYVPQGETWTRSDGVNFIGENVSPAIDNDIRNAYQAQYEADQQIENEALSILIGTSEVVE